MTLKKKILSNFGVGALAVGLMMGAVGTAGAATIVQNGSFEMDAGTGIVNGNDFSSMVGASGEDSWDVFAPVPGWTVTGSNGLEIQTALTIPLTPFDGDYYAELDGTQNTTISQSVSLNIGRYVLAFAYSPRVDSITTNAVSYGISSLFADVINGPTASIPMGTWTEVGYEFTVASAGIYDLFFDGATQSDSLGGFIDNVSISPVPLPAGGLLLLTALGGAAALRRRRKAA